MPIYMCVTCGTQFAESDSPPAECPICEDERQYVPATGQQWTTLDEIRQTHHNRFETLDLNITAIGSDPKFGIGQHANLIQSPHGNVLWDCISLLDDETVANVNELGGISAIAISHPHFYSSMIEWSREFDAPIYIHADNREYVMRPDPAINFWQGETYALAEGFTIIRCGGHFVGSQIMHWADGADGQGALLVGDTLQITQDRKFVSFMYSYPNMIPLPSSKVQHIGDAVEPFEFERIYSPWWGLTIRENAKDVVRRSVARYIKAISD